MNSGLNILILEDDAIIGESIHMHLRSLGHTPYPPIDNVEAALSFIERNPIDMAILDIQVDGPQSGIDLAKKIDLKHKFPYLFLTAFTDDKTIGLVNMTQPSGYLVKPFRRSELKAAISLAVMRGSLLEDPHDQSSENKAKDQNHIFVNVGGEWNRIDTADILYLESAHVYTEIHTTTSKTITRKSMTEFVNELKQQGIIRIHRSRAVNLAHVTRFSKQTVYIQDLEFKVSASFRQALKERLKDSKQE